MSLGWRDGGRFSIISTRQTSDPRRETERGLKSVSNQGEVKSNRPVDLLAGRGPPARGRVVIREIRQGSTIQGRFLHQFRSFPTRMLSQLNGREQRLLNKGGQDGDRFWCWWWGCPDQGGRVLLESDRLGWRDGCSWCWCCGLSDPHLRRRMDAAGSGGRRWGEHGHGRIAGRFKTLDFEADAQLVQVTLLHPPELLVVDLELPLPFLLEPGLLLDNGLRSLSLPLEKCLQVGPGVQRGDLPLDGRLGWLRSVTGGDGIFRDVPEDG